ncbi:MAG: DUF4167 domain-containing protein [Parvularculaceae bacterium]|nr:DUF4167 domain-containing protein [Parvularculaceae bacterium]
MKRGRNQRRRQGANPNRALDSNGPEVRIRGTAQQIYDKYLTLARDATSSGDRVKAENYLQHAEHYFRVLRAMQPSQAPQQENASDIDADGDQPTLGEGRDARGGRKSNGGADDSDEGGDDAPAAVEKNAGDEDVASPAKSGSGKRRAANGDAEADEQTAAGDDEPRKPRRRRPRRQPREETDADNEPAAAS